VEIKFRCDPNLMGHVPEPQPAKAALPAWLSRMPAQAHSTTHGHAIRTVKQCPPFVDAMTHGVIIPLPCDVHVGPESLSWDWDLPTPAAAMHPRSPLSFHVPEQLEGSPLQQGDQVAVKFNSFWTIELPEGYSLFASHPVNRFDLPFRLLTGLVDADQYHDVGILFPGLWVDPAFSGTLPAGTPVAQCFPVRRESLELDIQPMSTDKVAAFDELAGEVLGDAGVYRKRFRSKRPASFGTEETPGVTGSEEESPGGR